MDIDSDPFVQAQEHYGRRIFNEVLNEPYKEPDSCFFGNWHWDIKMTKEQRVKAMAILRPAYEAGDIRYACVNSA